MDYSSLNPILDTPNYQWLITLITSQKSLCDSGQIPQFMKDYNQMNTTSNLSINQTFCLNYYFGYSCNCSIPKNPLYHLSHQMIEMIYTSDLNSIANNHLLAKQKLETERQQLKDARQQYDAKINAKLANERRIRQQQLENKRIRQQQKLADKHKQYEDERKLREQLQAEERKIKNQLNQEREKRERAIRYINKLRDIGKRPHCDILNICGCLFKTGGQGLKIKLRSEFGKSLHVCINCIEDVIKFNSALFKPYKSGLISPEYIDRLLPKRRKYDYNQNGNCRYCSKGECDSYAQSCEKYTEVPIDGHLKLTHQIALNINKLVKEIANNDNWNNEIDMNEVIKITKLSSY